MTMDGEGKKVWPILGLGDTFLYAGSSADSVKGEAVG